MTVDPIALDLAAPVRPDPADTATVVVNPPVPPSPAEQRLFAQEIEGASRPPPAAIVEREMPMVDNRIRQPETVGEVVIDKIESLYGNLQDFQKFSEFAPDTGAAGGMNRPGPAERPVDGNGKPVPVDPHTTPLSPEFTAHLAAYKQMYLHTIEVDGIKAAVHAANSSLRTLLTSG